MTKKDIMLIATAISKYRQALSRGEGTIWTLIYLLEDYIEIKNRKKFEDACNK